MSQSNSDQQDFWTTQAGPTWVTQMAVMDAALAPILARVLELANLQKGEAVLDVGCGAGTSTIAAAASVGAQGRVCGVDISQTLLTSARIRADTVGQIDYLLADAQTYTFAPEYDCMISRFGIMFFDDFDAAFGNMARALKPGGRMSFATWGPIPGNPFFTFPAGIAKTEIGAVPKSDPDAPGPFALRDVSKVKSLLAAAGLSDITCDETVIDLTPPGSLKDVATLMCHIGPAERALKYFEVAPNQKAQFIEPLAQALHVYQTPQGIRIPALINFFTARKAA